MNLLKNIFYHILGLSLFKRVLTNINPKLTFILSMFSSIDMIQLTQEKKRLFKSQRVHLNMIR